MKNCYTVAVLKIKTSTLVNFETHQIKKFIEKYKFSGKGKNLQNIA